MWFIEMIKLLNFCAKIMHFDHSGIRMEVSKCWILILKVEI